MAEDAAAVAGAAPPWSTKITAYFVTGVAASIGLSAVAFYLGRMARVLLG